MLEQRAGVAVAAAGRRASRARASRSASAARRRSSSSSRRVGIEVAAERELQREGALVVAGVSSSSSSCVEAGVAALGDAVGLPGAAARPCGAPAQARRREVAVERAGGGDRRAPAVPGSTISIAPSRSSRRSAGIQRAVGDAPQRAERLAEALLQLVAVERLLLQRVRGWRGRACGSDSGSMVAIYRVDISSRYIERTSMHTAAGSAGRSRGRTASRSRSGAPARPRYTARRAPAHRLRAGPSGRPPRPATRRGHPPRRVRRPPRAPPGRPPRRRAGAATTARCAAHAHVRYVSYVYGDELRPGQRPLHLARRRARAARRARTTSSPATWSRCASTAGGTTSPAASCTAAATTAPARRARRPPARRTTLAARRRRSTGHGVDVPALARATLRAAAGSRVCPGRWRYARWPPSLRPRASCARRRRAQGFGHAAGDGHRVRRAVGAGGRRRGRRHDPRRRLGGDGRARATTTRCTSPSTTWRTTPVRSRAPSRARCVVADLPWMSYHVSREETVAQRRAARARGRAAR